ncbi:MAG: acyl-CoA dehydrogenase family protein [Alphaproteobacteria bacterium]|nr:acyl-CoA dehydrogenase family protein [Alphaproteobacteria bacterium]
MDLTLTKDDKAIAARAKTFAETVLFPLELECEENDGLSTQARKALIRQVQESKLGAYNHEKDVGGQGFNVLQQIVCHEELAKATGCLWASVWRPAVPLRAGTKHQIDTYLRPSCAGDRRSAYAITEPGAGSDASAVASTAVKRGGNYVINGEKWFVTGANLADFFLVHVHMDGDPKKPTLFLVEADQKGVEVKRVPKFTHNAYFTHAEIVFNNVECTPAQMLGEPGHGLDLTKEWFIETRLEIASRCLGGAIRAADVANAYASERVQFGKAIRDFQAVEFMLADMAVEIMATKAMLYRVGWEVSQGIDPKLVHARASAVKLQASEMVGRVTDKALQVLGGRGYMRENPVERLWREMRVERIWEGTSEIQRVIIGGQIRKRGMGVYTGWV